MAEANSIISTDEPRMSSCAYRALSTAPEISISSPTGSTHSINMSSHTTGDQTLYLTLNDHDPEEKPITQYLKDGLNIAAFPSLEDINVEYSTIFEMIEQTNYNGVEEFLAERGHQVEIIPKIGCTSLHYTKFNVANVENDVGDSPIIMAAKIDSTMVKIILKYGGNPNHTNEERDSPLSIAAVRGDRESIDALLLAGASLTAAVIKLTSYLRFQKEARDLMASGVESEFSVKSLTSLLSNDVYLKCRDPFREAFDVSRYIEDIVLVRQEYKLEFELLIRDADVFAYKMLDHCDKMWEAREVLDKSHGLLRRAIENRKKRFVSHPFSQEIIIEDWYGKVAFKMTVGRIKIAVEYILSPVLFPLYLLQFLCLQHRSKTPLMNTKFAEHMKLLFTPFMCFVTDVINYLILLLLLIAACVINKPSPTPHPVEFALWACIASRFLTELDQMTEQGLSKYLPSMWNVLELSTCLVITASAIYRIAIWKTYDNPNDDFNKLDALHTHLLNITYMYAITEFFLVLRWLNFLEFFPSLGPLLIALRYLIADVFKFVMIVLLTCVIGSTIAVYCITSTISLQIDAAKGKDVREVPKYFKDWKSCFKNIMWTTFGLLEMPEDDAKVKNDATSTNVIHGILVLYIFLAVVLMLNMLIALLNNTFEKIQENCDIEWKFARSEQLKEYMNGQPFLFPFHFLLIPVTAWFRSKIGEEPRQEASRRDTHSENSRDELLSTLCDRYARCYHKAAYDEMYDCDYERRHTFTNATAIQRHRSLIARDKKVTRKLRQQSTDI